MKPPTKEAGYTDDELASYEFARELATQIRDGRCPGIQRTNPPTHYHPGLAHYAAGMGSKPPARIRIRRLEVLFHHVLGRKELKDE
jgi:hypothetical protein